MVKRILDKISYYDWEFILACLLLPCFVSVFSKILNSVSTSIRLYE
jgi:ABC-type phosphate transport system permease subunit